MGFWNGFNNFFGIGGARVPSNNNISFFELNGVTQWCKVYGAENIRSVYELCSPLSSIISAKAEEFAGGKLEVLNASTLNYVRGAYKEWEKLMMQPNPLQNQSQFLKHIYTEANIYGSCFVLKLYPAGFKDMPYQMWVLPSQYIYIEERRKNIFDLTKEDLVKGVYFDFLGERTLLRPENLILFTDTVDTYNERTWLPNSRISNLQYPITTLLSAYEAEVTMIQKRGAIGILSNEGKDTVGTIAMNEEDKTNLEENFQGHGLSRGQRQVIITNAAVKWQPMTFPTKDLLLQESFLKAFKDICDAWKYPFPLTSHSDQSTYNNVSTADRRLYQSAIIPESKSYMQQLNEGLNTSVNNIKIQLDYSEAPALQQSEEEKGKGRKAMDDALQVEWNNGIITRNMWLEKMGEDTVKNPEFDKYKFEIDAENQEKQFEQSLQTNKFANAAVNN